MSLLAAGGSGHRRQRRGVRRPRIATIVGARPQFVKAAVLARYLREKEAPPLTQVVVHTGQHYDSKMSDVFFDELGMPEPTINLGVGSATAPAQVARMLEALDRVLSQEQLDAILVYGDTNSTLAAALAAAHLYIPLVHVEAGERIYRRRNVPEEINRILADHCATLCLTSSQKASSYLVREGMPPERVRFVGDPMYDLFCWAEGRVADLARVTPRSLDLERGGYHLATLHRLENTHSEECLLPILETLDRASKPVILPAHPRVAKLLRGTSWAPEASLRIIQPLGYFDFLSLLLDCERCVTDSGGVSREAFFARRPCIVPMPNCWWPEAVDSGWAVEVGDDRDRLLEALEIMSTPDDYPRGLFGDGDSSSRIADAVQDLCASPSSDGSWSPHGRVEELPRRTRTEFTYSAYSKMVASFQERGYRFAFFPEASSLLAEGVPFVLLRHDVDVDLEKALALAELEASLDAKATYFVMLRTDHYNVLSAAGSAIVKQILGYGHALGLHFDCAAYAGASDLEAAKAACGREARVLQDWMGRPVSIVSYHRPSEIVLSGNPDLSAPRAHAYMPIFAREIQYVSDSRGVWRHGSPIDSDAFHAGRPLHILVHPIWWNEYPIAPHEILARLVDRRKEALQRSIARNCDVYRAGWLRNEEDE